MKHLCCLSLCLLLFFTSLEANPSTGSQVSYKSMDKIWTDCSQPTDHGKIQSIVVDPNPPKRGVDISIIANLTVDEDITSGIITATIQIGPFPAQQKFNLCEELLEVKQSCPVKKGPLNIGIKAKIPASAPLGKYSGHAVAVDQNDEEIFCIKMDFDLK